MSLFQNEFAIFMSMINKRKIPEFEGLTEQEYYALVAKLKQQIEQLETEQGENQKTIAELSARKAYMEQIKR